MSYARARTPSRHTGVPLRIPSTTPESDYSQTPTLNVSPALQRRATHSDQARQAVRTEACTGRPQAVPEQHPTKAAVRFPIPKARRAEECKTQTLATAPAARGSLRRGPGPATTLDSSNSVYRPRGDVHGARGATPSKKNSYDTVSGSITPAVTALDVREPPQRPVRQATVPSTRDLVYGPRGDMRDIPGATSAQAVCIPTASGSMASAAIVPVPRALQRSIQVIGSVLRAPSSIFKPHRATRDKNDLAVLLRQQSRRFSKCRYPQKQCHTHARSGDSCRPSGRLRVSQEKFLTTAA